MLHYFSCVQLCDAVNYNLQASLSMGFSSHEHWSGLLCPPPRYLLDPGIEAESLTSSALVGRFFTASVTWKPIVSITSTQFWRCIKMAEQESMELTFSHKHIKKIYRWNSSQGRYLETGRRTPVQPRL